MGIQNSVVKSHFGEFYKVQLPRENIAHLKITPKSFWNEESTQQFINNLTVPNGYWKEIINEYSTLPSPSSLTTPEIEKQVCRLMIQGQLKLFPVEVPDIVEHPPENRVLKGSNDILYRFAPVSALLFNKSSNIKKFKSTAEAETFISELGPNNEQLVTITKELDIKTPNTASINKNEVLEAISKAILSGQVIIIIDEISNPPPTDTKIVDAKDTIGNRRADKEALPVDEFKEINIELNDEFDKGMPAHFELFNGLEFKIKTDLGEEHTGTIKDGKIFIAKAKMNSSFEIKIDGIPAFLDI